MQRRTSALDRASESLTQHPFLSEHERVIMGLLAEGHSNCEIAREVAASRAALGRSLHALVRKLGARNRVQAVANAIRSGLI